MELYHRPTVRTLIIRSLLKQANQVTIPWVTAVYKLRMVSGDGELRSVSERSGWLANLRSGAVTSYESFSGVRQEASWLPDEATARGWWIVTGFAR